MQSTPRTREELLAATARVMQHYCGEYAPFYGDARFAIDYALKADAELEGVSHALESLIDPDLAHEDPVGAVRIVVEMLAESEAARRAAAIQRTGASRVDPALAVDKARSADFSVDPACSDTASTCTPASDAPAPPRETVLWPQPEAKGDVCGLTDWRGVKCTEPAASHLCLPHMKALAACLDAPASPAQEATPPRCPDDPPCDECLLRALESPAAPTPEATTPDRASAENRIWAEDLARARRHDASPERANTADTILVPGAWRYQKGPDGWYIVVGDEVADRAEDRYTSLILDALAESRATVAALTADLDEADFALEVAAKALRSADAERDHWKALSNAIAGQHDRAMDALTAERGARES